MLNAGIHYTIWVPILPPIYNLEKSMIVAKNQRQFAFCRLELTDFIENCMVYDGNRLRFFSFRLLFHPVGG